MPCQVRVQLPPQYGFGRPWVEAFDAFAVSPGSYTTSFPLGQGSYYPHWICWRMVSQLFCCSQLADFHINIGRDTYQQVKLKEDCFINSKISFEFSTYSTGGSPAIWKDDEMITYLCRVSSLLHQWPRDTKLPGMPQWPRRIDGPGTYAARQKIRCSPIIIGVIQLYH